ncbi:alpha,alpha-trehalose-phosphate synthase (UDP-forming) [Desulfotignum balticum]|jgi:trehalose 6-phosphate synthase|uniref:alpha,alpha-trehalose-phosphate synthase (UDP-forming) n=1 Tax=Desulfotignum balticum TaxID=115781 RepID=UPI0004629481|nr:trehalose-6-phosphate synthase [Desulfotignum balticum]
MHITNKTNNSQKNRLIIVSNRLPIVLSKDNKGRWQAEQGSGGLITALAPVLKNRGGLWIGWPGTSRAHDKKALESVFTRAAGDFGYTFEPVFLPESLVNAYYFGFSNQVLWPLFHDLQTRCDFSPDYWNAYQKVNEIFARTIAQNIKSQDDHIWVHDYHLMGVGQALRKLHATAKIGYFLHIPFPPLDIFLKLPWRFQILESLLCYDMIGFQTQRDRRNFVQCVHAMLNHIRIKGRGQVLSTQVNGRMVRVGNFPISIDYNEFAKKAGTRAVEKRVDEIRAVFPSDHLILGVDRLDYSKGIPERLLAFRNALQRYPELEKKISMVQIVVPSRQRIPEYENLKHEIEQLISEINGTFTRPGWVPIHYLYQGVDRTELTALYRAADIALVTPLKDGMNLVAKEYCASNIHLDGVLILSEFAGASSQLYKHALLVNPHDIEGIADAINQACHMGLDERKKRMRALRKIVKKTDIYWWVDTFLKAVFSHDLDTLGPLEDYIPSQEISNRKNREAP